MLSGSSGARLAVLTVSTLVVGLLTMLPLAHGDGADGPVRPSRQVPGVQPASLELARLQRKIREVQAAFGRDRQHAAERVSVVRSEARAVERTLKALQERLEKRRAEIEKKREELAGQKAKIEQVESREEALKKKMAAFLDGVKEGVAASIPWKRERRLEQIDRVQKVLKDPLTVASSGLGAVGRIQQEEEALGRLVETGVLEVDTSAGKAEVRGFHLGLLAVIFSNDDGSVLGYARSGEELEDGLSAMAGADIAARGYQVAVDILRRRRTPAIVEIFLPSLPVKGDR